MADTDFFRIEGAVKTARAFSFDDLAGLPGQVADVGSVVPGREGAAVLLRSVIENAAATAQATHLTVTADDGEFSASVALDGLADAVLVYRLGAGPLPREKGGPVRLLIPGAASCGRDDIDACANVKFVARLELTGGPGTDTRPTSNKSHEELHRKPGHEHLS